MRKLLGFVIALAVALPAMAEDKTICEVAADSDQFTILTKAVKAAGLEETLKGEGPFTVLAPTDEAFKKLPEGKLEELLKPENKEKLAGLLKLHVIKDKVTASQVVKMNGKSVATCCEEGSKVMIKTTTGGDVAFSAGKNTANVVKADILASNGVIHAIDAVILPDDKDKKDRDNK